MKIFLTGATGYIGSAVARAACEVGHEVHALVHGRRAGAGVEGQGFIAVPGDLRDAESLARHAGSSDAVVHAANTGGPDAAAVDAAATRAMVGALEGSGRPFLYTSGVWVLGRTGDEAVGEDAPLNPPEIVAGRASLEAWLRESAARQVRTVIVRPAIVYGDGGGIPGMIARGELPLVGDGTQLWPLVHRDDLASLYLAALERAQAGSILHGVALHRTAAEVWAAFSTGSEPLRASVAEARVSLGAFADALALNQRVSARATREWTGWVPRREAPSRAEATAATVERRP